MVRRLFAALLFLLSILLGVGGFIAAMKPSIYPLLTTVGAFALPAIFFWWGVLLLKSARRTVHLERTSTNSGVKNLEIDKTPVSIGLAEDTQVTNLDVFDRLCFYVRKVYGQGPNNSRIYFVLSLLIFTLLTVIALTLFLKDSEIEKCINSGIRSYESQSVWDESETWKGMTREQVEYRIRLTCMRSSQPH
jgi:hypothetical protein